MHADAHVSAAATGHSSLPAAPSTCHVPLFIPLYTSSAFGSSPLGSLRERGRGSKFYLAMSRRPLVCLHIPDSYEIACHCLLITGGVADPRGTCSLCYTILSRPSGTRLQSVAVQSGSSIRLSPVESCSIRHDQLRGRSVTLFQVEPESVQSSTIALRAH